MRRIFPVLPALLVALPVAAGAAVAADVAILMAGSRGIVPGDFLVRNEGNINCAGIRTILTTPSATCA